jgi:hypothetical protein
MRVQVAFPKWGDGPGALEARRWYTYDAPDGLQVGQKVELPGSFEHPDKQVGTVMAVESDYDGPVRPIERVL